MTRKELIQQIKKKRSVLCVGLDTDPDRLPEEYGRDAEGVLAFNQKIIELTQDLAISYKINTAFYESLGWQGWQALEQTLDSLPEHVFSIADAKRGDIGNTAEKYATAFFDRLDFDAVTVNPYMGVETLAPYTTREQKWAIVLGLTSNPGSADIELQVLETGNKVYEHALDLCTQRYKADRLMMVVGATQSASLADLRARYPDYFFLMPGIGAQGGDLDAVLQQTLHPTDAAVLINVSRGILYPSTEEHSHWQDAVRSSAEQYQRTMQSYL